MTNFIKNIKLSLVLIIIISILACCKHLDRPIQDIEPIYFKSATELTRAIRQGEIKSLDLLNLYLDRIQRYNNEINAIVALDIDAARERAAEADKAIALGQNWGPLHGLPMTVKDVFEVVGMPATSGDPELKDYIPKRNAISVQRLIDAGAIVFGKSNVPYHAMDFQSYNQVYGTTNNPWDLSRTPGGSSGGSAAALSAGLTPLELGSDMGGSVRIPANYTGVFGHKTTFGVILRYGHIPPMPGSVTPEQIKMAPLFIVGPLARSADDLELALEVLEPPTSSNMKGFKSKLLPLRKKRFSDYRVAVWFKDSFPAAEIDTEVLTVLQKTVDKLRTSGLQVDDDARPDISLRENLRIWYNISEAMKARALPLYKGHVEKQKKQEANWADFFEHYDVLLAPVAPTLAFPHDHSMPYSHRDLLINDDTKPYINNLTWSVMAIVSGLPVTVAPVGLSKSGLPVGVQIIGAKYDDRATISFARGLSELLGGFNAPPGYVD